MASRTHSFDTIRIEGGILPADFLNTVAAIRAPIQKEADYDRIQGFKDRGYRISRTTIQCLSTLLTHNPDSAALHPGYEMPVVARMELAESGINVQSITEPEYHFPAFDLHLSSWSITEETTFRVELIFSRLHYATAGPII